MKSLRKLDRPARHRATAALFRVFAVALVAAAVNEFPPTNTDAIRTAIAYLACLILAMILCLIAVLHDLVAATVRPKALGRFRMLEGETPWQ